MTQTESQIDKHLMMCGKRMPWTAVKYVLATSTDFKQIKDHGVLPKIWNPLINMVKVNEGRCRAQAYSYLLELRTDCMESFVKSADR